MVGHADGVQPAADNTDYEARFLAARDTVLLMDGWRAAPCHRRRCIPEIPAIRTIAGLSGDGRSHSGQPDRASRDV